MNFALAFLTVIYFVTEEALYLVSAVSTTILCFPTDNDAANFTIPLSVAWKRYALYFEPVYNFTSTIAFGTTLPVFLSVILMVAVFPLL